MEPQKYYLYRHTRLDTNEVFYIGIGTITSEKNLKHYGNTFKGHHYRAFKAPGRNPFWKNIVNKTKYEVEIMFYSDCEEEINNKEIEFIKLYGRRDLGLGALVNLTDGGGGIKSFNHTQISKDKIGLAGIGRKHSKERYDKVQAAKFKAIIGINKNDSNDVVEFNSVQEAALFTGKSSNIKNISACANNKRASAYNYKWKFKN